MPISPNKRVIQKYTKHLKNSLYPPHKTKPEKPFQLDTDSPSSQKIVLRRERTRLRLTLQPSKKGPGILVMPEELESPIPMDFSLGTSSKTYARSIYKAAQKREKKKCLTMHLQLTLALSTPKYQRTSLCPPKVHENSFLEL